MAVHPIDFEFNQDVFSTPELRKIFDEKAVVQRWLDFEAALAEVQAENGIIPREAAAEIRKKATLDCLDPDMISTGYQKSRNSLIPVIKALRAACQADAGQFVHYGPTTQDVLDTAQVLALRQALGIIVRDLEDAEGYCLELAYRYKDTSMVGRTHGQQALPITFGLKVAVWLKEIRSHIERLKHLFSSLRFGQFGGAVGTLASLGPQGIEIARKTLERLGLDYHPLAWHTRRDSMAEMATSLSMLTATLCKMANEIYQLQKTEVGELREPPPKGQPASSTMPHKQNPVICQRVAAIFQHVNALAHVVVEGMCHEHERDPRCLWSEWLAMPQLCIYSGAAVSYIKAVLSGLEVDVERMRFNLDTAGGFIVAEWLLFRLAEELGKMDAMEKVSELVAIAKERQRGLKEVVLEDPTMARVFTEGDLDILDRPELYVGNARQIIALTIEETKKARALD